MRGFRVYDTINKKYVTNKLSWVVTPNGELCELDFGDLIGHPQCIKEDDTGLTDKNGNKIFEGDIIKDNYGRIMKIVYEHYRLKLELIKPGEESWTNNFKYADFFDWVDFDNNSAVFEVEIIGNIHDNPELLEGVE